jgi:hypothetical protein
LPSGEPTDTVLLQDSENSLCAKVVHVGQLVPCIVLRVDDDKKEGKVNRRVWLSLRLSLLYRGLSLDGLQEGMVIFNHPNLDVLHKLSFWGRKISTMDGCFIVHLCP